MVIVIGTPVGRAPQPRPEAVPAAIEELRRPPPRRAAPGPPQHRVPRRHRPGRAALLDGSARHRRRVLPGAHRRGQGHGGAVRAAPDRVGPHTARAERAAKLFGARREDRRLEVEEAELAKLFTNTWRYIKFAAANQLYMIANDFGCDFERIRRRSPRLPASGRHARGRVSPPVRACSRTRCSWPRSTTTTSRSATPA